MIRVVAALLLIWEPLNFAVGALTALPTIGYRGWMAATELAAHGVVAAVATAAALALWNRTPAARRLASIAIVLSVARTMQATWWSALPSATVPGSQSFIVLLTILVGAISLAIVNTSKQFSQ